MVIRLLEKLAPEVNKALVLMLAGDLGGTERKQFVAATSCCERTVLTALLRSKDCEPQAAMESKN